MLVGPYNPPMSTRIAVVFDFDDTLAPDSTTGFLESLGVDAHAFWNDRVGKRLADGWDPIPAYLYEMIQESRSRPPGDRITLGRMREFGGRIPFFPGVSDIFETLRGTARGIDPSIDVEFYLISSGIEAILRASSVAHEFHDIWGCSFHLSDDEEIVHPKNIVSFTEKTRFLFQISKGLIGPAARGRTADVNRKVRRGQYRIPLEQTIFVGDGQTDVPCFALIKRFGGLPIGVYDPDRPHKWDAAWNFIEEQRVANLHSAKFRPGDDLHNTLLMAVKAKAAAIAHRRAGAAV